MDTDMMQELRDLMDGPLKSGPIELVDSLIKDGMNLAYKQLMHVKDGFKKDPKSFNSDEMNIKILYKEKVDRDNKLKLNEDQNGGPLDQRGELQSMKQYIKGFCKQFNVNLKFEKFPIQLFMD